MPDFFVILEPSKGTYFLVRLIRWQVLLAGGLLSLIYISTNISFLKCFLLILIAGGKIKVKYCERVPKLISFGFIFLNTQRPLATNFIMVNIICQIGRKSYHIAHTWFFQTKTLQTIPFLWGFFDFQLQTTNMVNLAIVMGQSKEIKVIALNGTLEKPWISYIEQILIQIYMLDWFMHATKFVKRLILWKN